MQKKKEILFALEKKTKYHRALKKEEEKKPVLPAHFERILKKSDFFFMETNNNFPKLSFFLPQILEHCTKCQNLHKQVGLQQQFLLLSQL